MRVLYEFFYRNYLLCGINIGAANHNRQTAGFEPVENSIFVICNRKCAEKYPSVQCAAVIMVLFEPMDPPHLWRSDNRTDTTKGALVIGTASPPTILSSGEFSFAKIQTNDC